MSRQTKLDFPLVVIGLLLLATLAAFLTGLFPYPYGFIILSLVLIGRIFQLQDRE